MAEFGGVAVASGAVGDLAVPDIVLNESVRIQVKLYIELYKLPFALFFK